MLRFSANLSMLFTEVDLPTRFLKAKEVGFQAVEIQFPYDVPLSELQAAQSETGLEVVLINVPAGDLMAGGEGLASAPNLSQDFYDAVELAKQYAVGLSVPTVNVLAGRCLQSDQKPLYLAQLIKNLTYSSEEFRVIGVRVLTEAINNIDMPDFLINTGDDMLSILSQVNHENLAMQLDFYHMCRMKVDPLAFLLDHLPRIGHIQIADLPGRGEPGSGKLPFADWFAAIKASAYSGWVGAEYNPQAIGVGHLDWFRRLQTLAL